MNDEKLLELAAKAVGAVSLPNGRLHHHCSSNSPSYTSPWSLDGNMWQPLISDADAFRLMVKLNITIDSQSEGCTGVWAGPYACATEPYGKDRYAATRRAIVRVAASSINYSSPFDDEEDVL